MEQLQDLENQPPDLRADILAGLGFVRRGQQRYEETVALWEEAVQLGRGVLRQFWIEQTENNIAAMKVQLGDLHTGRAMFSSAPSSQSVWIFPRCWAATLQHCTCGFAVGGCGWCGVARTEANQRLRTGTAPPLYRAVLVCSLP